MNDVQGQCGIHFLIVYHSLCNCLVTTKGKLFFLFFSTKH